MLSAILMFEQKLDDSSVKLIQDIELFGRDILSSGYVKLMRMVQICSKEAEACSEQPTVYINYVLDALQFYLTYELIAAKDVTQDYLDKKAGVPGFIHVILGKMHIVKYMTEVVEKLAQEASGATTATDMQKVLQHFQTYTAYRLGFPAHATTQGESEAKKDGGDDGGPADEEPAEIMKKDLGKAASMTVDFFYDLLGGDHDKDIANVLKEHAGPVGTVKWPKVAVGPSLQPLKEIVRQINLHSTVIHSGGSDGRPAVPGRGLAETTEGESDERAREIERERAEAWKNAQTMRRKFISIQHCKFKVASDLDKHYQTTKVYKDFQGRPGISHRIFVFSMELLHESGSTPWSSPVEWNSAADVALDFILNQKAIGDTLLVFDGRSSTCRRKLDRRMFENGNARNPCELFVVYSPTQRLGRKVSFASDNKEVAMISLPCPRTQYQTKERAVFSGAGEVSTHDSTYTAVPPMAWAAMPCMTVKSKTAILGAEPPVPNAKLYDSHHGQPLFWQERKTKALWSQLIRDLDGKAIYDLTPGSGTLARACMELGVQYCGVARSADHMSWLQNVLDRAALLTITTSGTPLFEQDLAECIRNHFSDVVTMLNESDAAADEEPQEDDVE